MATAEFTAMDLAVIRCLRRLCTAHAEGVLAAQLTPCLLREFPDDDEVIMRQGESLTRLRGKQYVDMDSEGRIALLPQSEEVETEL